MAIYITKKYTVVSKYCIFKNQSQVYLFFNIYISFVEIKSLIKKPTQPKLPITTSKYKNLFCQTSTEKHCSFLHADFYCSLWIHSATPRVCILCYYARRLQCGLGKKL